MTAIPSRKTPKLRHHKASGQGCVVLDGRTVYLGRYDLPETRQKYHQVLAEWMAGRAQRASPPNKITVVELLEAFLGHAEKYYVQPGGGPSKEQLNFKRVMGLLKDLYGHTKAIRFGPLALKAVRHRMIELGWCRRYVNQQIGRIKRIFRWASENEVIDGSVYHALQAVAGLRSGRTEARESKPVRPVPPELIDAVEPYVCRQVWAMIQLQLLTAARGGEIVIMRPCDVDRSGKTWLYRPATHKTAWHGHDRTIYIGPEAQQVLKPFLLRPGEAYCFSPAEAEAERCAAAHAARQTPMSCGNRPGTNRKSKPGRKPGDVYTPESYARAITYAVRKAFPPRGDLAKRDDELWKEYEGRLTDEDRAKIKAWHKQHHWHPHQLRHNAATELRKEFGLETARIILGHRSAAVTLIYAEADQEKAIEAIAKVG